MLILPDSSAWISFFAGRPGVAPDKLEELIEVEADVCVCDPTNMEVLEGIRINDQHRKIGGILDNYQHLDVTRDVFREAANICRTCRAKGFTVRSGLNCLICATALQNNAWLRHNDRDLDAIAKFFPPKFF